MISNSRVKLLNIELHNVTREEALERFGRSRITVTPNIDHLWNLQWNSAFHELYQRADLVLCDSRVLSLLLRFCGIRIEALPGSEFFPEACRRLTSADPQFSVFLLGGTTPEHTRLAAARLGDSGVRIAGAYSPSVGFDKDAVAVKSIASLLEKSGASFVGVGLGSPKQELLIGRLLEALPHVHFVGIGATIDFESGLVSRAPKLFGILRLEWFYRFLLEPTRLFRRYFVHGPVVLFLLAKQLLGLYRSPFDSGGADEESA